MTVNIAEFALAPMAKPMTRTRGAPGFFIAILTAYEKS
jgi:hypothetical protein